MEKSHATIQKVTGDTAPVDGIVEVQVKMGTFSSQHFMYVASIFDDCIIGMDFLRRHSCEIKLKNITLECCEEIVYLNQTKNEHGFASNSCDVRIAALLNCWITLMAPAIDEDIVLATSSNSTTMIDIPSSVCRVDKETIQVCVTNISEEDICIPRSTTIVGIESNPETFLCRRLTADSSNLDLTLDVREMLNKSSMGLTCEQQTELTSLVFRNGSYW